MTPWQQSSWVNWIKIKKEYGSKRKTSIENAEEAVYRGEEDGRDRKSAS